MHATLDDTTKAKRQDFYGRLAPHGLAPLWEVMKELFPPEPKSKAVPHIWRSKDYRPLLLEAGGLLTAEEAERRVLVLENPALVGLSRATATLYAGVQLIMPGETAPAHRHSASALRFMLEGEHGFTAVGGERTTMREGDFVITPAWAWHDHGNEGEGPVAWMDGLDIPTIGFYEAVFAEEYNDVRQTVTRPEGDSLARFGEGLLPVGAESRYGLTTPIFNYPYERTRAALVAAAKGEKPDSHLGVTLRYSNPLDGGWTMPTMAAWMTHLKSGFETAPIRSTDSMVMCVAEGSGEVRIDDATLRFSPKDIVAIPGWTWRSFSASSDCFLFFFSDRVVHEKLGFFREERRAS
jgi:gentisate 1,2-dioxygenase